jgi:hypothetical protein
MRKELAVGGGAGSRIEQTGLVGQRPRHEANEREQAEAFLGELFDELPKLLRKIAQERGATPWRPPRRDHRSANCVHGADSQTRLAAEISLSAHARATAE